MKYIFILLSIITFSVQAFNVPDKYHKYVTDMQTLIDNNKYEEAAKYSANYENRHISEGYRALSTFINHYSTRKDKEELVEKYIIKACELGDYHSCRTYADILASNKEYKKAEIIYLNNAENHSDPASAGRLVSLYHNRSWEGFNNEKAKYWQFKIPELAKKESNNLLKMDQ